MGVSEALGKTLSKLDLFNKVADKYGKNKASEIFGYYGGDVGKDASKSFINRVMSGDETESPLLMYHSTSEDKLQNILSLADKTNSEHALPNPSLQVVDPDKNIGTSYGELILLGNKSIPGKINKYSGKPEVGSSYNLYDRDIYSPRAPFISERNGTPYVHDYSGSVTSNEASPENISKMMNSKSAKASESSFTTPGSMAATQARKLKTPLDAIKSSGKLTSKDDLEKKLNEWNDLVGEASENFANNYLMKYPSSNAFEAMDNAAEEIQNKMMGMPEWEADPYGINTKEGDEVVDKLKQAAKELPTAYFEAKANRAVPLSEFGGAVVPEGFNNDNILEALKKAGVEIKGYYNPDKREETLKPLLQSLAKSDRFNTKYLYGAGGVLGGGSVLGGLLGNSDQNS